MNVHAIEEIKDGATDSRPVLAIRLGRGRTGGSTFLDFLAACRTQVSRGGRRGGMLLLRGFPGARFSRTAA